MEHVGLGRQLPAGNALLLNGGCNGFRRRFLLLLLPGAGEAGKTEERQQPNESSAHATARAEWIVVGRSTWGHWTT